MDHQTLRTACDQSQAPPPPSSGPSPPLPRPSPTPAQSRSPAAAILSPQDATALAAWTTSPSSAGTSAARVIRNHRPDITDGLPPGDFERRVGIYPHNGGFAARSRRRLFRRPSSALAVRCRSISSTMANWTAAPSRSAVSGTATHVREAPQLPDGHRRVGPYSSQQIPPMSIGRCRAHLLRRHSPEACLPPILIGTPSSILFRYKMSQKPRTPATANQLPSGATRCAHRRPKWNDHLGKRSGPTGARTTRAFILKHLGAALGPTDIRPPAAPCPGTDGIGRAVEFPTH